MPRVQKRGRAQAANDENDDADSQPQTQTQRQRQRRHSSTPSDEEDTTQTQLDPNATSQQQMIKNLVRLALATEYSRTPLRRADISSKVLGTNSRQFKNVFDGAQLALRQTFGMELVELPQKEKVTLAQRKAAQKSGSNASTSSSKSWILKSLLPAKLQHPDILSPPKVPTEEHESAYVGLYSFVAGVITLSGGTLPEAKLERYLKRTNAEQSTPIERTDKVLAKMIKDGYIVKYRELNGGEEVVEYMVGPRGKVEIGLEGTANLVRSVYGRQADEELDRKLDRSLKIQAVAAARRDAEMDGAEEGQRGSKGRPRRAGDDSGGDD